MATPPANLAAARAQINEPATLGWAGCAMEDGGWYTYNLTHGKYYGKSGINTGVFFFSHIPREFKAFCHSYEGHTPLGDQDDYECAVFC
jgi:hypothetical protein